MRPTPTLSRRAVLRLAFAAVPVATAMVAGCAPPLAARPPSAPSLRLRVGGQSSGTFAWLLTVLKQQSLDRRHDLTIDVVDIASKTGMETAFRGGSVDVVVDDFIAVARYQQQGFGAKGIAPYSTTAGMLVVPSSSPIATLGDLRGKRIGVPALTDKQWILLRAVAERTAGIDLQKEATAQAASAPQLTAFLDKGDLDAAFLYWQNAVPMVADGKYHEVLSQAQLLQTLGITGQLPTLFYIARGSAVSTQPAALRAFLAAIHDATAALQTNDALWQTLVDQKVIDGADASVLPQLRDRWRQGVPSRFDAGLVANLQTLMATLVATAGAEAVGAASLPAAAFDLSFGTNG